LFPPRRIFWIGMLLLHLPAMPSLWAMVLTSQGTSLITALVRLVGLLASAAFFILKTIDVPWLRLRAGPRSAITGVLVIALAHVGVVDRAIGGTGGVSDSQVVVLFLSSAAWQIERIKRGLRESGRVLLFAASAATGQQLRVLLYSYRIRDPILGNRSCSLLPHYCGPRSPPLA
jgi:hypothetical protein